jgi:hypothetical protein
VSLSLSLIILLITVSPLVLYIVFAIRADRASSPKPKSPPDPFERAKTSLREAGWTAFNQPSASGPSLLLGDQEEWNAYVTARAAEKILEQLVELRKDLLEFRQDVHQLLRETQGQGDRSQSQKDPTQQDPPKA